VLEADTAAVLLLDQSASQLVATGVPLLVGGTVIGVLHVGSLSGRPFGQQDADLLQHATSPAPATWAGTGTTCSPSQKEDLASSSGT
jgi:hypothetical protein